MKKTDKHHNDRVGRKRPDGKVWKLMLDADCRRMLTRWLKGDRMRDLIVDYKITECNFGHQKYYHIKRLCSPFMLGVLKIFESGGSLTLVEKFKIDLKEANKLYSRSNFYLKHRRRGIDKLEF